MHEHPPSIPEPLADDEVTMEVAVLAYEKTASLPKPTVQTPPPPSRHKKMPPPPAVGEEEAEASEAPFTHHIPADVNVYGTTTSQADSEDGDAVDEWQQPVAKSRPTPHQHRLDPWMEKVTRPPKPLPPLAQIRQLRMTRKVYAAIRDTIGSYPAERGGMLLSSSKDYVITDFVFDAGARSSGVSYNPNTSFLNEELEGREDHFVGIVHSHPPSLRRLSSQDRAAAWSNLTSPGNPHLQAYLMPLVMTIPDTGKFELLPFIVTCSAEGNGYVDVRPVPLKFVD